MRWRLSGLMFLLYAVPGSFAPVFSRRMEQLGFTPNEIGRASATGALAGLVGPMIAGQLADRWLPPERCLTFCALASSGLLWYLAGLSEPWPVFFTALAVWMFVAPSVTLCTAITLGSLIDPQREFGRVRLWGTVGWIVPAFLLGAWLYVVPEADLSDCFRLGALCAVIVAAYSFTLPHLARTSRPTSWLAPVAALALLRDRSFAVYVAGSATLCVGLAFATQGMPLLLARLEVPDDAIPSLLTVAQSTEIVTLFGLPVILPRFGTRATMLTGMITWGIGLSAFAFGGPLWLVVLMLGSWGVMICFYIVAGQVFVNARAHGDIRTSTQALLTFVNAIGQLVGNLMAGWLRGLSGGELGLMFGAGAGLVAVMTIVFLIGFRAED